MYTWLFYYLNNVLTQFLDTATETSVECEVESWLVRKRNTQTKGGRQENRNSEIKLQ
jgi:hypothetical protein